MISPIEPAHGPVSHDTGFMAPTPDVRQLMVDVDEHITAISGIPGVLCKPCLDKGDENWVVPGLPCSKCGTAAPSTA